jgi:hypothetical protein
MKVENLPPEEEWRRAVDQFRAGKKGGKADKHVAVLISVLSSSSVDLGRLLLDFSYLPSGVVGRALHHSYSSLSNVQRSAIWEWIAQQKQERQEVERAYALPGAIRADPEAALVCLLGIRATTKEQKERLVSVLSGLDGAAIASLFNPAIEEFKARKAIQLLLTVAEGPHADERVREAILEGVLPAVGKWRLDSGVDNFRAKIVDIFERLPANSASRIAKMLPAGMQPANNAHETPEAGSEETAHEQDATERSVAEDAAESKKRVASGGLEAGQPHAAVQDLVLVEQIPFESQGTGAFAADQFAWLNAIMQLAAHPKSFWVDIRQQLDSGEKAREELQRKYAESQTQLGVAQARIQQLQSAVDQVSSSNDAIQKERHSFGEALARQQQAMASLESSMRMLQEREQGWGREREELSHRINNHAERTLEDFKVALSFAISPLVRDLPDMGSPRLAELAPNLRVIIRQILGVLTDQGVEIRGTAGVTG